MQMQGIYLSTMWFNPDAGIMSVGLIALWSPMRHQARVKHHGLKWQVSGLHDFTRERFVRFCMKVSRIHVVLLFPGEYAQLPGARLPMTSRSGFACDGV